jgi:hypothetical protein
MVALSAATQLEAQVCLILDVLNQCAHRYKILNIWGFI